MGEKPGQMFKGKGCNMCANTGFGERVALVEMLGTGENIRRLILAGASSDEMKSAAVKEGHDQHPAGWNDKSQSGDHHYQ